MDLKSKLVKFFNPDVLKIVLTLIIGFIALTTMPIVNNSEMPLGGCGPVWEAKPPLFLGYTTYSPETPCSGIATSLVTPFLISLPYWYSLSCVLVYFIRKSRKFILNNS